MPEGVLREATEVGSRFDKFKRFITEKLLPESVICSKAQNEPYLYHVTDQVARECRAELSTRKSISEHPSDLSRHRHNLAEYSDRHYSQVCC